MGMINKTVSGDAESYKLVKNGKIILKLLKGVHNVLLTQGLVIIGQQVLLVLIARCLMLQVSLMKVQF